MEDKKLKKFTTLGKRASNMIKDKIEDIKYLILDVILKCLMKVFKSPR